MEDSSEKKIVLVDLNPQGRIKQVSIRPEDLAAKSAEVLERAMDTIEGMAERTIQTIDRLTNKPSEVEVEFGIKLDAEAGALIAKTGGEASLTVKLVWKRD
ncbi:MAG: CU044_2847 family protein [Spirulina sp.]